MKYIEILGNNEVMSQAVAMWDFVHAAQRILPFLKVTSRAL